MILADTSVWIDHLRRGNDQLGSLLEQGTVVCHPFVVGELGCGTLKDRREFLSLISAMPSLPLADHAEAMHFLGARKLMGRGLGWVDVHLLASALIGGARVLTLDVRLRAVARALRIAV